MYDKDSETQRFTVEITFRASLPSIYEDSEAARQFVRDCLEQETEKSVKEADILDVDVHE